MPADRARRNKETNEFDIVVIPVGQGGTSRTYRMTRVRLWLLGVGSFLVICVAILAGLIFTPLASIVPIPNSVLEEKYGRQLLETQKELQALADQVLMVSEYNRRLQKALGNELRDEPAIPVDTVALDSLRDEMERQVELVESPTGDAELTDIGTADMTEESFGIGNGGHPEFPLSSPVSGIVSQGFQPQHGHYGIDYASATGTPVFAAGDGYVVFSGWTHEDGNMMMISHGPGYLTVYKHNRSLMLPAHAEVKRNELIALLGSSGRATGPHLHFEVWKDGIPVDPALYLLHPPAASLIQ